jgi:hypothetical protein
MANRLKSTKKEVEAENLVDDKEEVIEVKSLVRDERTLKIIGSVFLFVCFFLFVSFTSYLFTWSEDQDKIRDMGARILRPNDLEINNLLGSFGAYVAFVFFEYGFGIASYLFCSLFFVVGVNYFQKCSLSNDGIVGGECQCIFLCPSFNLQLGWCFRKICCRLVERRDRLGRNLCITLFVDLFLCDMAIQSHFQMAGFFSY